MSSFGLHDIDVLESSEEASAEDEAISLQRAINGGAAWSFQGSYGRAMMDAIKAGFCMLGENGARDYWGNYIPARNEVKAGSFGSREFVVARRGEEWALMLEAA